MGISLGSRFTLCFGRQTLQVLRTIEEIIQEVAIICMLNVKTEDSAQNKLFKG